MSENLTSTKPWYKKWWAITLAVIIVLILIGNLSKKTPTTTSSTTPEVKNQPQETSKSYQQIFTFSGNGTKKTEPFTVTGSRFKIAYDCKGSICQATLYKMDSKLPQLIMNSAESVKDETIMYGAGEYYIDVNTIGSYTMTVYDYK